MAETSDMMIGESRSMMQLKEAIAMAAPTNSNVLILGESGTGKELVAQRLHSQSKRSRGPFVALNCANLSGDLIESVLFGYEKGATLL